MLIHIRYMYMNVIGYIAGSWIVPINLVRPKLVWLKNDYSILFNQFIVSITKNHRSLLVDGDGNRNNLLINHYTVMHSIHIQYAPKRCTGQAQPLDVGVFEPVKASAGKNAMIICITMVLHHSQRLSNIWNGFISHGMIWAEARQHAFKLAVNWFFVFCSAYQCNCYCNRPIIACATCVVT